MRLFGFYIGVSAFFVKAFDFIRPSIATPATVNISPFDGATHILTALRTGWNIDRLKERKEISFLEKLLQLGIANGVEGLRLVTKEEIKDFEDLTGSLARDLTEEETSGKITSWIKNNFNAFKAMILGEHRQPAIGVAAGRRHDALGDLALEH